MRSKFEALLQKVANNYGYKRNLESRTYGFIEAELRRHAEEGRINMVAKFINVLVNASQHGEASGYLPRDFQTRKNKLQPSSTECMVLQDFSNILNFADLSPVQWLEMTSYLDILSPKSEYQADYAIRAEAILRNVRPGEKIVLMDGHGRIVRLLISMMESSGQYFDIEVVDLDEDVHKWHTLLFPKNIVKSVHGDIFNVSRKDAFIYLNFCGVSHPSVFEKIKRGLPQMTGSYMFSCSTARAAANTPLVRALKEKKFDSNSQIVMYFRAVDIQLVSLRSNFITVLIKD